MIIDDRNELSFGLFDDTTLDKIEHHLKKGDTEFIIGDKKFSFNKEELIKDIDTKGLSFDDFLDDQEPLKYYYDVFHLSIGDLHMIGEYKI